MSTARSLAQLRADVDALTRPLAKCLAPSRRELSEDRATGAFRLAIRAAGLSQRAAARRLGVCDRVVRDWLDGARALPAWAPGALPIEGQIAYARAFTAGITDDDSTAQGDEDSEEARCA